jgi:hypothetical protein
MSKLNSSMITLGMRLCDTPELSMALLKVMSWILRLIWNGGTSSVSLVSSMRGPNKMVGWSSWTFRVSRVSPHLLHFNNMILIFSFLDEIIERDKDFNLGHFILKVKIGGDLFHLLDNYLPTCFWCFPWNFFFEFPFLVASLVGLSFFGRLVEGAST